jgi:tetratricopeptide (TPR) repeat protein
MLPKLTLPQNVREDARPVQTAALVLEAALDAHRDGTLSHLLADRPGAARWLTRIFLQPILGAAGDALPTERAMTTSLAWLMEWAITQLRPDRAPTLQIDDRKAWLDSTSWRPAIAVMCHYGFVTLPDFKDRYYRRPDESPADSLCGLWNIGPSTYYRYLEKAKRLMARALYEQRLDGRHASSLREYTRQQVYRIQRLSEEDARAHWHNQQIGHCLKKDDSLSAVWHARHAGNYDLACDLIQRHAAELSGQPEIDPLLKSMHEASIPYGAEVKLWLAQAMVHHTRSAIEQEREAYNHALKQAVAAGDDLLAGIAYSHLGKFYEPRDPDRSLSCYQNSVEYLRHAEVAGGMQSLAAVQDEYAVTLAQLAWLYVLRNDPRAKTILEHADAVCDRLRVSDLSAAMLEQCWGEYWRRAGNMQKALEHQHRTLNIYERAEDLNGLIKAYINLGLTYSELRNLDRAIAYLHQAIDLTKTISVSSEVITSAYLNLGACYFWRTAYREAIHYYNIALQVSEGAHLLLHQARAHHNIAEAHYILFAQSHLAQDERKGDAHAQTAQSLYIACDQHSYADAVKRMKAELLHTGRPDTLMDRLLPEETASNYAEATMISEHRKALATPAPPETHIRAHLAIANAYLSISAQEREAAMALIEKHGLAGAFEDEFKQLHTTFSRELAREQQLDMNWKASAGDFIDTPQREALLKQLLAHGFINKSVYAELGGVSLATASKHLGMLTERGLLVQTGRGPATRYVLPQPEPA